MRRDIFLELPTVYRAIFVDPGKPLPAGARELDPPELEMLMKVNARRYYEIEATAEQRAAWGPTAERTKLVAISVD